MSKVSNLRNHYFIATKIFIAITAIGLFVAIIFNNEASSPVTDKFVNVIYITSSIALVFSILSMAIFRGKEKFRELIYIVLALLFISAAYMINWFNA